MHTVLLTAKNIFAGAGHPHMFSAKSWLSEGLLTPQGTGRAALEGQTPERGTLQQWSHTVRSHTHHELFYREPPLSSPYFSANYNHYPVIPIGSESLHPAVLKSVSFWGSQPVNTTFELLEVISAEVLSSPSKSNSWNINRALDSWGDVMRSAQQWDSRYRGGDCSPALFHLWCSAKTRIFHPFSNSNKTLSQHKPAL